ncbi:chemotaxis protein CheW [Ktedonospora formicarum]
MEHLSNHEFWALARKIVHSSHTRIADIHEQHLECRLKNGKCVVSLEVLCEVVSPPFHFSQFPSAPAWMLGVGAWREDILPIIDFEAYLTHTPADQEGQLRAPDCFSSPVMSTLCLVYTSWMLSLFTLQRQLYKNYHLLLLSIPTCLMAQ